MDLWADYLRVMSAAYVWLYNLLVPIGTGLKSALTELPLWRVRFDLAVLFLILAIWCFRISKKYVMEDAPKITWWNDPRRWAVVVLGIQIALYVCL